MFSPYSDSDDFLKIGVRFGFRFRQRTPPNVVRNSVRNWGSPPRPQEGRSGVTPRIGSVGRDRRLRCGQRLAPRRRAPGKKLSAARSQHRPTTQKPRGAPARHAEPPSPGRRRAAWVLRALRAARWVRRPPPREGRPACRTAYWGTVSGSCEDHLVAATRRPRPRASPMQHLLLRFSVSG